jgi:uncharacterized protein GlcG (DUF336 family)
MFSRIYDMNRVNLSIGMICLAALANSARAELPETKVLTFDAALSIAQAAMAACRADGYRVSVVVVDGLNAVRVTLRDDGANAATSEVARMKATSAMLYDRPSGPPSIRRPEANVPAGFVPLAIPGTVQSQGGLPIKVRDATIGAVAVSGAPGGDKDAACASAALSKAADKLR